MSFQLVRASETDIAIWQTEHGHIFVYRVGPDRAGLEPLFARNAPDASLPVETFAAEALAFATREAETRNLIGAPATRRATRRAKPIEA